MPTEYPEGTALRMKTAAACLSLLMRVLCKHVPFNLRLALCATDILFYKAIFIHNSYFIIEV